MIRPMDPAEIRKALRRAAQVCMEKGRSDWWCIDVCRADDTFGAIRGFDGPSDLPSDPEHAAFFLLLVAAAMEATNA